MSSIVSIASLAAQIGDPSRAAMLVTLMDGRALTAGELAEAAGVTPPTASGHLGQLLEGGLLSVERQGRHRYYRIAKQSVAALIETMMAVGGELDHASVRRTVRTGPRDPELREARMCYDHLAGRVAVTIADSLIAGGGIVFDTDGGFVTDAGKNKLSGLGIDVTLSRRSRAALCRPCLDWSERRPHVGGQLGRSICRALMNQGWLRAGQGRKVMVTPHGRRLLALHFGVEPRSERFQMPPSATSHPMALRPATSAAMQASSRPASVERTTKFAPTRPSRKKG